MKALFFLYLINIATCLSVFSQDISSKKYDFNLRLPSYDSSQELNMFQDSFSMKGLQNDTIYFKKFDNPDEFLDLNLGETNLFQNQDNVQFIPNPETVYSLRIMKPSSNYPIQIYKPDSTKKYTLLIKDF
ncbi:hypothetical protein SYJ56_02340 [Algoriphagus sp. D3-2-R+10]|uniref:hypothetical protein n=1 Tax=Algoriphagus aurantiacus TaxID=3103948 RepID=UPI002B37787B|nr:hypothetical protein [Algoriphagus sp. D3-2-R+10]MEB2774125.1 hypothetical protein [Algoriphagus sp. D3-2-R+10]